MGIRTQAPIRHQHIPCVQARMDCLHLSQVMREEGCDDQLQEHPGARLEAPQQPGDGNAEPGARHGRLAARVLERRGIRQGAARPSDHKGARAVPPPCITGALEAQRRVTRSAKRGRGGGAGLTLSRGTAP